MVNGQLPKQNHPIPLTLVSTQNTFYIDDKNVNEFARIGLVDELKI